MPPPPYRPTDDPDDWTPYGSQLEFKPPSFYFPANRCWLVASTLSSISGLPCYSDIVTSHPLLPIRIYMIPLMRHLLVMFHGKISAYVIMALDLNTMYHPGWMANTKFGFVIHAPSYTIFYPIPTSMVNSTTRLSKNMMWKVIIGSRISCQATGHGNRQ